MPRAPHRSLSSTPSLPTIFIWVRLPLTWKPVPKMIVSTSCTVPSAVTTPFGADLGDRVGDDVDVVLGERGVVVVGEQDALAADLVVRRQPGTQLGIGDLLREVFAGAAVR